MRLENKTIGILFMNNYYIKERLLYEIKRLSEIKNVEILPILENTTSRSNNKIFRKNINEINKIAKNKSFLYDKEMDNTQFRKIDVLIVIGFNIELMNQLYQKNFESSDFFIINYYEKINIPIIIGINGNIDFFSDLNKIKILLDKKQYYIIPFLFPNPITKPNLITFDTSLIIKTTELALNKVQLKPIISKSFI